MMEFLNIIQKVFRPELKFDNSPEKIFENSPENIFHSDHFSYSGFKKYGDLKIAILANLGQLTREIFRANNA